VGRPDHWDDEHGNERATTKPKDQTASTALDDDPVTFSVILRRLEGIADEMTLGLELSSWTTMLALNRDFSCAIYDAVPRQLCMHETNTVHTTGMHIVMGAMARKFEGDIHDGDVLLCNDPFGGNTHVGDVVAATPVFSEGRHVLWSVAKAHHTVWTWTGRGRSGRARGAADRRPQTVGPGLHGGLSPGGRDAPGAE